MINLSKRVIRFLLVIGCWFLISSLSFAAITSEGIRVYPKNVKLSPEHRKKIAEDLTRFRNADNLWDLLREEFSLSHYEENPEVQAKIDWYMNNQDFLLRSATRAAPYLYFILQQVKKRHLPVELVLLPIIESGYNPFAYSTVGAAGIWQMMPATATGFSIKQDWWYDGRRDVIASTRAALNYLSYLQHFFDGNWLLAIAAYNTGEGNIQSAIRRNIRDGKDTDFWSLPVAQETKSYIPSLLALATIISHPEQYPIYFPPVRNAPYLAQVEIGVQMNLKHAAVLAGISSKKMLQLNSGFKQKALSPHGPYRLVLPIENVEQFIENATRSPLNPQINWQHYKVKSGDTLFSIAQKFNVAPADIRGMNHLTKTALHSGVNLLIPFQSNHKEKIKDTIKQAFPKTAPRKIIVQNGHYTIQPNDTIYMVRNNDTLEKIAKRFHIDTQTLIAANHLQNHVPLASGKQLVIPTHAVSSHKNLSPGDTIYIVRKGESIEKIASKFNTSASAVRLANLLMDNKLKQGDRLIIPTHFNG